MSFEREYRSFDVDFPTLIPTKIAIQFEQFDRPGFFREGGTARGQEGLAERS